jgi:hypothetical protein
MISVQHMGEGADLPQESVFAIAVVVDMDFNVADATPRYLSQWLYQFVAVLLLRIEERVDGRPALGVSVPSRNLGPLGAPAGYSTQCSVTIDTVPQGLVVISDHNPNVPWRASRPAQQPSCVGK